MGRSLVGRTGRFRSDLADFMIAERVTGGFGLRLRGYYRCGRGFVVETDEGPKEIFPLRYPPEEYRFACQAADFLRRQGFSRLPRVLSAPDGRPVVRVGNEDYAMRDWVPGTAADLDHPCHLSQAVEMLAWFHRSGQGFRPEAVPGAREDWGSWPRRFAACVEGFYRYEGLARGGGGGDRFDRLFLEHFDEVLAQAARALEELAASPYDEVIETERECGGICHRDYHGRHLIFSEEGVLFLTDFDDLAMETRLEDLGNFLLHHGDWDPERILCSLHVYRRAAPLSRAEFDCLLAYLRCPFACWEAVDAHYREGSSGRSDLRRAARDLPRRAEVIAELRRADLGFLDGFAPLHHLGFPSQMMEEMPAAGPAPAPQAEPEGPEDPPGAGDGGVDEGAPAESPEPSAEPMPPVVAPAQTPEPEAEPPVSPEGESPPLSDAGETSPVDPAPSGPAPPLVWRPFPAPLRRVGKGG